MIVEKHFVCWKVNGADGHTLSTSLKQSIKSKFFGTEKFRLERSKVLTSVIKHS